MIRFDRLWKIMEQKNITTYQLREQCGIDSKTVRRLKANDNIETKTLNKLCAVLLAKSLHFIKVFKARYGCAPLQYRKRIHQ